MTTVHNRGYERMRPGDILIDRSTEYGNEYHIGRDGTRREVIAKFEAAERIRIATNPERRAKVKALYGKRLFCWCAPQDCHGNVYKRLAAELNSE